MNKISDPTQAKGNEEMSPVDRRVHGWMDSLVAGQELSVRKRGLIKLAVGIPLGVGWFLIQQRLEALNEWLKFLVPGFPGVLALIGLTELVSGIPIAHLSRRWEGLKGWQRGVLGTLILFAFAFILFSGMYLFLVRK